MSYFPVWMDYLQFLNEVLAVEIPLAIALGTWNSNFGPGECKVNAQSTWLKCSVDGWNYWEVLRLFSYNDGTNRDGYGKDGCENMVVVWLVLRGVEICDMRHM